jgi:hypothetical protein
MSFEVLKMLGMHIIQAFLCLLFLITGIFAINVAVPLSVMWLGGFVLISFGTLGLIMQLFLATRKYKA